MATALKKNPLIVESIFSAIQRIPNIRTQEIVERRFGLKESAPETLEAIGSDFLITRERVRQIENEALKRIRKEGRKKGPLFILLKELVKFLESYQGIVREERIFKEFKKKRLNETERRSLVLLLTAGNHFLPLKKVRFYKKAWYLKGADLDRLPRLKEYLIAELLKIKKPVSLKKLLSILKESKEFGKLPEEVCSALVEIPLEIEANILGRWGLSYWPQIRLRGVRDKIYLVFKKTGGPMHFSEAAEKVNSWGFNSKKVCQATVHNELIRDKRFVLIGRGIYALKEWNYSSGTVADVLVKIMKENKNPLTKDFLLKETLKQRKVKPETVILNLQRTDLFSKKADGLYSLKRGL
jgi:hypothetical protein